MLLLIRLEYSPYYVSPFECFTASKGSHLYILFAITAAAVAWPTGDQLVFMLQ